LLAGATGAAPWAKAGLIAVTNSKPYIATESQNAYVTWHNAPAGSGVAKASSNTGVLEGSIDLAAAFGAVPTNIYLCAAAYATADGGALVSQSPTGSGANIEPGEFLVIPTVALNDVNADGVLDRTDPALDFVLQSISLNGGSALLNWTSMPGRTYRVMTADSPTGPWTDIVASQTNAGALQLELGYGDGVNGGVTQRFYRIKLLP